MERWMSVVLAAAIVAFAWFAYGSLTALLLATAKLTLVFFLIAGIGELAAARSKATRPRP